jgi:molybdopterin converting factor small subunit
VHVRVLAFARAAEVVGWSRRDLEVPAGAATADVWQLLCEEYPGLLALAESTRLARNGRIVVQSEAVCDGDEVALLPPVGGG